MLEHRSNSDAEFLAGATAIVNRLEEEIRRVKPEESRGWRALEIGCGSGRLLRPLSGHFLELHGVDISGDLLAQAREKAADLAHVRLHRSEGATLSDLPDASFDFAYSCDFFPHLPSREMIVAFLREIQRVLRPGALVRMECPGAQLSSHDLLEFAQTHDFQVLALEGAATPSIWTTWRKQSAGWSDSADARVEALADSRPVIIRRITNASSFEPVAPCRGRFASIALRVEHLPPETGIQHLRVTIGSSLGAVTYIGPVDRNGWRQIRVDLPELEATGLLPVQVLWLDRPLSEPATLRVIPPGPLVPRVVSAPKRVENRRVSILLEEIERPWEIEVFAGGRPVEDVERICIDPRPQRYNVSFQLPDDLAAGTHAVTLNVGRRQLPPLLIEVA